MKKAIPCVPPVLRILIAVCCVGVAGARDSIQTNEISEPKRAEDKSKADKESAAAFVREHRSDIVFIKNKLGSGSGFIVLMKGRKVLITNAHVLAGLKGATFELLDRSPLRLGVSSLAFGHDLAACVILEGGTGMPMATGVEAEAQIGDAVVVPGNAAGDGVVNMIQGELVGIGPDRIEVNAPFEPGNSGSPIIHLRSGKVIGVATYAKLDTLLSGGVKLRRFGYRLDSARVWHQIEWNRFYSESDLAEKILTATFELDDIFSDFQRVTTHNLSRAYETPGIRSALENYYNAIGQSRADNDAAVIGLLGSLREVCVSDVAAAKTRFSYDYFKRELEANELVRNRFVERIKKVLQP
jgi:hypothetical protein